MQLLYAIRKSDEAFVHIQSVPNGKECQCKCPGCGEDLIAKNNGKIKIPHFAHEDIDRACQSGYQTQLHLLSKAIFSEVDALQLPVYTVELNSLLYSPIQKEKAIQIKNVISEKKIDSIIPDITLIDTFDQRYLIEIKVTHAVDEEKKEKIKNLNISCLELDLSTYNLESKDQLKQTILSDKAKWRWVYLKDEEKKIEALKTFTETIRLETNSKGITYTAHCPLKKIKDTNLSSAEFIKDCKRCPFNLATANFEDSIQCGGKLKISSLNDLEKIKEVKKEKDQITSATLTNGSHLVFTVQNELFFGSIIDLWEGKQLLLKTMGKNFAYVIKENPKISFSKDKKVKGDIYSHKRKIKDNINILGADQRLWYKIIKDLPQ